MDRKMYAFFMSLVFLFLFCCLGGAIWLMNEGKDGWGCLILVIIVTLFGTKVRREEAGKGASGPTSQ